MLADDVLSRVRQAASDGWIGGFHQFFGGGCSGDAIAFSTYEAFLSRVLASRPGDLFTLWSIAEMRRKGLVLIEKRLEIEAMTIHSLISPGDLARVRAYLAESQGNEILAIASSGDQELAAIWTDLDGTHEDRFLNSVRRAEVPGGAICILPITQIDSPDFYLVKAKRPNEKGEIPLGGAY